MKILLLTPFFSPGVGGSSRLLNDIVEQLLREGHGAGVITYSDRPSDTLATFDRQQSFPIWRIYQASGLRGASSLQMLVTAVRLVKSGKYDRILSGVGYSTGIVAFLVSLLTRTPFLVYSFGEDITVVGDTGVKRAVLATAMKRAKDVITISHFTKRKILDLGVSERRLTVVPPGIDTEPYAAVTTNSVVSLREQLGLGDKTVLLLTVARLTERKGHDVVVRSLPHVARHVPNVHYLVVGAGDAATLERIASEVGVSDRLTIVPFVTDNELPVLYHLCDVYVMVSRYDLGSKEVEGFGIVYLEAAACGRPCVAGSHGGSPDAVEDGKTGFIVDPTSVDEVSNALLSLLTDKKKAERMGAAGRDRVKAHFERRETLRLSSSIICRPD